MDFCVSALPHKIDVQSKKWRYTYYMAPCPEQRTLQAMKLQQYMRPPRDIFQQRAGTVRMAYPIFIR